MKFATKLFNLILLAFTFCFVTVAEWGVYNLTALPSGINNTIGIVSRDTGEGNGCLETLEFVYDDGPKPVDVKDDNIAYFDTFGFFGTDIAESVTRGPRYMIRGWFSWDWWQSGMEWADKVAEVVIGAVVPIAAPTYEASQLKTYFSEYRGSTDIVFYNTDDVPVKTVAVTGVADHLIPECHNYLLYKKPFVDEDGDGILQPNERNSAIYRVVEGEKEETPLVSWNVQTGGLNQVFHVGESRSAYNSLIKINKYNSGSYDHWVNKFLAKDTKGNYVVKQSVSALYFQFYLAIVFSIWFVYQNPIVFDQNPDGSQTMHGGLHWRHRRKEKKKDKDKNDK